MRKRFLSGTLGTLFLTLFLTSSGCSRKGSANEGEPAAVPSAVVTPVIRENLASTLTVAGQFEPFQDVDLHAKVSGYIRRINVDIGDRVRAGAVIATLEVPELDAQVAGAQAQVRHSQSEIARAQSEVTRAQANHVALHEAYTRLDQASKQRPGLVAQQELDDAFAKDQNSEAQIDVAKAALEAARQQLGISQADDQRVHALSSYSVVTAPFDGVVSKRYADTGSLIQAGTASNTQAMPVVRLAQSGLLRLRMPVPEVDVPFIQKGGEVQVKVQATGKTFTGKIIRFTRALDTSTRTMLVEVDVPNPKLTLSPGMYAETVISLQQRNHVLTVPSQAVMRGDGDSYVLALDQANKVQKKLVTLGIQGADRTEIVSGLSAGEQVIVSGQVNYQSGETVRPRPLSITMPHQGGSL
ncbi:MAG TPA: efflux RND transporter periplasmic adaptor subunit [Bryobacteraceae bacterium]